MRHNAKATRIKKKEKIMITWKELFFGPINLLSAPAKCRKIPDADCEHCKYKCGDVEDHCYLHANYPGKKCREFKRIN